MQKHVKTETPQEFPKRLVFINPQSLMRLNNFFNAITPIQIESK